MARGRKLPSRASSVSSVGMWEPSPSPSSPRGEGPRAEARRRVAERDAAALASRASSVYTSAATAAADDEGNGYRNVTYFFPNPSIEDTELEPGVLSFANAESESRYLSEHVPSLRLSCMTLAAFILIPAALVYRYHFIYVDKGLTTLALLPSILLVEAALALCALLHVWARVRLPRHRGLYGFCLLQRIDCVLACLLATGLCAWEVVAKEHMGCQGYFHPLLVFLIVFCLTSRHMVFRAGASAAWFSFFAYAFTATVGSLEQWPVEHSFEYNTSAVPGYNYSIPGTAAPEMKTEWTKELGLYRRRNVSWYTATIDDPLGHTGDDAAMFIVGALSLMLCLGLTSMNFRAELAERAGWEASTRVNELYELANEQDRKLEHLLEETIPKQIVPLLKESSSSVALQAIPDATVLAVELVGFEEYSDRKPASAAVELLNMFYSELDGVVKRHGCEKIKTCFGNRMIVMSGLPLVREDHAAVAAECAMDMVQVAFMLAKLDPSAVTGVRIGLHSGPVVAGIIGSGPLVYDVWGDSVPTALRVMKTAEVSTVKVSHTSYGELQKQYKLEEKGAAVLKGGLRTKTYVLQARKYGNDFAKFQVNLGRIKNAQGNADKKVAVNISDSVRALCAFPSRTDWSVLRDDKAKPPKQFSGGLDVFGEGFPIPEFRRHRQHGWELNFSRMQAESSLHHHQMTILWMLILLSAGAFWQQRWCEPLGLCPYISLQVWITYLLVTIPLVVMLALVIFFTNIYLKAASGSIMVLVIANFIAFILFANAKEATPPAEVGWYGALGMLFYSYFGAYMKFPKAVFGAVVGSVLVFLNVWSAPEPGEPKADGRERRDLLLLHLAVHVPGILALAAYERGRRLYFGWWTLLRKSQEEKKGNEGPGRCEKVLYLLIPNQITSAVNKQKSLMTFEYPDAAILVVDLAGFTQLVTPPDFHQKKPGSDGWMQDDEGSKVALIAGLLSDIVSLSVQLTVKYDVLFARMSGASMIIAAGVPDPSHDGACKLAHLAFDLVGYVTELCARRCEKIAKQENTSPTLGLKLRMGLAVGEVKTGLVGFHKFSYDLWGQAMEMADGLQMIAQPDSLQCNARARQLLVRSGDFATDHPRDVLIRGSNPKPSYEVERVHTREFVERPTPRDQRFWKEHEADAEQIIIDMVRIAETQALHEFVQSLQLQTKMRLAGKQGVQLETREQEQKSIMEEITLERCGKDGYESASGWVDPVPDRLSGVAAGINDYMDTHIQQLKIQHAEENEKMAVELKQQSRDFIELLADQRSQLELGSRMSGVLRITKLSRLIRMDVFSLPDAYVVVYWNGEHIGDTEVVKDDLEPEFHETDFDIAFYTQQINTLELEVYDWAEGLNPDGDHTFLGQIEMSGRGVEFLPTSEKDYVLQDSDDPTIVARNVGGEVHVVFTASHDREVEERMLEVWMAVDCDGNGTLDRDEMFEVLTKMGEKDIDMDKVMAEVDEDNSGEVDFDEFRKWFFLQDTAAQGAMHATDNTTTAERIFQQVDIDASGDVSFDEFSSWWTARAKGAADERDEELDENDLEDVLEHALELFHKYDVDGGGGLDPDEFAAMIRDMAYEEWFPASSNGRQYFFNIKTKETRWTLPELGEELLDKFVDRQATLEVSGDKAASKLMTNIDNNIARQRTETSNDPIVHRKIMNLTASKRIMVQQFVDVGTILFDANSAMVDAFVRSMDEDKMERQGAILKMKTLPGGGVQWKKRWVEIHDAPKGRRVVYRKKQGKREMHTLELVGCRFARGVWRSKSMEEGGECWEDVELSEAGGLDETTGRRAMHCFTVIALEPFVVGGATHYEEDCYTFACGSESDMEAWVETLAIPEHALPITKEETIDVPPAIEEGSEEGQGEEELFP
jgi:class 3 adenylate cyclase/Ca2+-binding EF-hand superfamily protein